MHSAQLGDRFGGHSAVDQGSRGLRARRKPKKALSEKRG